MSEIALNTGQAAEKTESANTVWILTEVYHPEEISTGYYLTSIAEGLADGRRVKVITGQPKHMARGKKAPKREIRNEVEIFRAWGTTLDKNVLLFRLINMATIGLSVFFRSLRVFRPGDQVLVVTAPPSLPVTTAIASLVRGATYTLLVQDSYPEILIAVGAARPDSTFVSVVNVINRWVYKYADRIIVMGRDMRELFEQKTRGLDIPVVVIPNWADLETINPEQRGSNALLDELGLSAKFVFLYAGNIGHPTDIKTLVDCAEMLLDHDDIHFLFIGAGAKKKWLEGEVGARSLANTTVLDYRPRSEQNIFLNACNVGLVALIKGMWGTAMPSRTYNIMAAGKPILALTDDNSELARVIDEERIGWHTEPGDAEKLRDLIIMIYSSASQLPDIGKRAREAAIAKYSRETAVAAYCEAMTRGQGRV
jgi:colanic acid biosynthesis glycosyl transferase WcaI